MKKGGGAGDVTQCSSPGFNSLQHVRSPGAGMNPFPRRTGHHLSPPGCLRPPACSWSQETSGKGPENPPAPTGLLPPRCSLPLRRQWEWARRGPLTALQQEARGSARQGLPRGPLSQPGARGLHVQHRKQFAQGHLERRGARAAPGPRPGRVLPQGPHQATFLSQSCRGLCTPRA